MPKQLSDTWVHKDAAVMTRVERLQKIVELQRKIKRARANCCRQRNRELMRMEVRVSSEFWRQVQQEYELQLREVKRTFVKRWNE